MNKVEFSNEANQPIERPWGLRLPLSVRCARISVDSDLVYKFFALYKHQKLDIIYPLVRIIANQYHTDEEFTPVIEEIYQKCKDGQLDFLKIMETDYIKYPSIR